MKVALLCRRSEFQIYAANQLWRAGHISAVLVEDGYSFHRANGWRQVMSAVSRNARTVAPLVLRSPGAVADYAKLILRRERYFGSQDAHHRRLLVDDYSAFAESMPVVTVSDINSEHTFAALRAMEPGLVLVFGTALIHRDLLRRVEVPWVNMHWGWSPNYRGEGIISALAREGPEALGVTVHLLSTRADGGDILYQARPTVDAQDNFYSIGLKLTRLGVELFARVVEEYDRSRQLKGAPQDLSQGRVYSSKYIKANPGLCHEAWRNLQVAVSPQIPGASA